MKSKTLINSKIQFEEQSHTYTLGDSQLMGVTSLMKKHLFANKYTGIPEYIMQKASERGTEIHSLCTAYNLLGIIDEKYQEVANYADLLQTHAIEIIADEYLVGDLAFATMIDNVGSDYSLYDIKTTAKLDKEYLSWQLSIGAYLFEKQNPKLKVPKLYGIWLRGEIAELVEVPRIEEHHIINLFMAELNGVEYENPFKKEVGEDIESLINIEEDITELEAEVSRLKEKRTAHLDKISEQMKASGMKKMDTDRIVITIVGDRVSKRFDSTKFKAENTELYEQYQKESTTKGHIKIKLK